MPLQHLQSVPVLQENHGRWALPANLKNIRDLYSDIQHGVLPAVSTVKPEGLLDGHPASAKPELLRIPMTVVSPYSRNVGVSQAYDDHVSFEMCRPA